MFKIFRGFNLVFNLHKQKQEANEHPSQFLKKLIYSIIVLFVTLFLWNIPADWYGIEGLTVIQQRIIAIFAFATLMWILEIVPSWATSVAIIVLMLLTTSNSGIKPLMYEEAMKRPATRCPTKTSWPRLPTPSSCCSSADSSLPSQPPRRDSTRNWQRFC